MTSRKAPPRCVAIVVLAQMLSPAATMAVEPGDTAPAFALTDGEGHTVRFPEVAAGRPAVILFWATWCPYCKAVMPYLETIRAARADDGVQVFAVNIKEDGDPAAYARDSGYEFRWLLDGDAVAADYAVRFTPGLLVVDGMGRIVYRRESTDLPPGRKVAEYWAEKTAAALDQAIASRNDSD